jgi:hypothetical protein
MMTGGCSKGLANGKVCVYVILSSIVVSEIIVPSSSFIYQQDKNDYNNKRIPLVRYLMGKGNQTKYLLTNKVLSETINQHKSRITKKQRLSDNDPIRKGSGKSCLMTTMRCFIQTQRFKACSISSYPDNKRQLQR